VAAGAAPTTLEGSTRGIQPAQALFAELSLGQLVSSKVVIAMELEDLRVTGLVSGVTWCAKGVTVIDFIDIS
jgi:hypothetical protein